MSMSVGWWNIRNLSPDLAFRLAFRCVVIFIGSFDQHNSEITTDTYHDDNHHIQNCEQGQDIYFNNYLDKHLRGLGEDMMWKSSLSDLQYPFL